MMVPMSPPAASATVYRRTDQRFAFRVEAANGEVIAVDGAQGYERAGDAGTIADRLERGYRIVIALERAGLNARELDVVVNGLEDAARRRAEEAADGD
jgi:hypothetical protein